MDGVQITSGYLNNIDLQGFKLSAGSAGVNIAGGGISQGTNSITIAGDLSVSGGLFINLSGTDFIQGNVKITGDRRFFHPVFDAHERGGGNTSGRGGQQYGSRGE